MPLDRSHSFGNIIADRHKSAVRMLGYSLTADSMSTWQGCSFVWAVRLRPTELGSIAFVALSALDPGSREDVAVAALYDHAPCPPLVPFGNVMPDARWWASNASRRELKGYAAAAFDALPQRDRAAFLDFAGKVPA